MAGTSDIMRRIAALSRPLDPIPVPVSPRITPDTRIRAVIFDVYGTLLISGSGDVGTIQEENSSRAIEEAFRAAGLGIAGKGSLAAAHMKQTIGRHHEARRDEGSLNPEVDIREVWSDVFATLVAENILKRLPDRSQIEVISVEYECRNNPVWPMPGMIETLAGLRNRAITLGIVSNAQFFTPPTIEALTGEDLPALGFRSDCTVFSYELLEAKPSVSIFTPVVGALARELSIAASEVLYVGNDMRNDILPAAGLGLKTALFAGDARSYRTRTDDPDCAGLAPDFVITDLRQIIFLLGGNP